MSLHQAGNSIRQVDRELFVDLYGHEILSFVTQIS